MCGRLDIIINSQRSLFKLAERLGLSGTRPTPAQRVPLVRGRADAISALWGWPRFDAELHVHARSENADQKPTWRDAWRHRRGVVPIGGWWEGKWHVTGTGMHLAVLWGEFAGAIRVVVVTQEPGWLADRIERLPIPLTEAGALAWLATGDYADQVRDLTVANERLNGVRNQTIFDV